MKSKDLILLYLVLNLLSSSSLSSNEWYKDTSYNQEEFKNKCDFPIIEFSQILNNSNIKSSFNYPYIIRNAIFDWPAFKKWEKASFIELFGSKTIRSGSESSIVHSGGIAESEMTLENMINQMYTEENKDYFVFDTTILSTIPELINDINIPEIFQDWDNKEQVEGEFLWHMLSLGPSKTGLPFHNHGKTWLAVIHGVKQWYIYPPGYDTPSNIDMIYNPLFPISTWLVEIYPKLTNYSKPPLISYNDVINNELTYDEYHLESNKYNGYRPLECTQIPGDLIFIPSRWVHLTVNQGETIAIGGQETLFDNDRYNSAKKVLENHPNNYEAWKDLGLAQSNMATSEYNYIHTFVEPYILSHANNNLVSMSGNNVIQVLDELLLKTRDTWMVLYYDSGELNHNKDEIIYYWSELAKQLDGIVNIAIVDLNIISTHMKHNKQLVQQEQYQQEIFIDGILSSRTESGTMFIEGESSMFIIDTMHEYEYLPIIKIHRGDQLEIRYDPDYQGISYLINDILDIDSILRYLKGSIEVDQLALGSITKGCVAIKRKYHEALLNLKHARSIKPLQMELLGMIAEIAGLAHDLASMHEAVVSGIFLLDQLHINNNDRIPAMTFASMYHQLARSYILLNMAQHAQPLIQTSLDIMPTFIPSMKEIISIHILQHNKNLAQDALEQLKNVSIHLYYNNNDDIQYYQIEINKLN